MPIADGYIRVSAEEQAREGLSLATQEAKIRDYAKVYDIEIDIMHADEGESAKSLDRPGIRAALDRLDRRQVEGLVIFKLDRLSRDIGDWDRLIKTYFGDRAGRHLWSVTDKIDTATAAGRMVLNMMMVVAQWEREAIAERTSTTMQYQSGVGVEGVSQGRRMGAVKYGYDLVDDGRRSRKQGRPVGLAELRAEMWTIVLIIEMRDQGMSLRKIAAELDARGIPTKQNKGKWTHQTVDKILKRGANGQASGG